MGWEEFIAIELGLLFTIHKGFSDVHFLLKSDNQGGDPRDSGRKIKEPLSEHGTTKDHIFTFTA